MKYAPWVSKELRTFFDDASTGVELGEILEIWQKLLGHVETEIVLNSFSRLGADAFTPAFIKRLTLAVSFALSRPAATYLTDAEGREKADRAIAHMKQLKMLLKELGRDESLYSLLPDTWLLQMQAVHTADGGNVSDLLDELIRQLTYQTEQRSLVPTPASESADRTYFIRFMYEVFTSSFGQPLISTIARLAHIVLDDYEISDTLVQASINRYKKSSEGLEPIAAAYKLL